MHDKNDDIKTWALPSLGQPKSSNNHKAELEQALKQAKEQGYQEGQKLAQEEVAQKKAELNTLIQEFSSLDEKLSDKLKSVLEQYCYHALVSVLKTQLPQAKEAIAQVIEEGIESLKTQKAVVVHLSPTLYQYHTDISDSLSQKGLTLVENTHLGPLDIHLETQDKKVVCELMSILEQWMTRSKTRASSDCSVEVTRFQDSVSKESHNHPTREEAYPNDKRAGGNG